MLVRDVMTVNPITIRPESDYLAAIAIMRAGKLRRLPVVSAEGRLTGILSSRDLQHVIAPEELKDQAMHSDGVLVRVHEVMRPQVITCPPDYPLEEAARLMVEHRIGCLPVLEEGHLVGIITDTDIFSALMNVLGGGSRTIRLTVRIGNTPGQFAELTGRIAGAGGNIISLASHPAPTPDRMNATLRVEGVSVDALLEAIRSQPGLEILYTWEPEASEPE